MSPSRSLKSMIRLRCRSMPATWCRLASISVVPSGLSLASSERMLPSCDRLLPGARLWETFRSKAIRPTGSCWWIIR